jgi:hypothetical protein
LEQYTAVIFRAEQAVQENEGTYIFKGGKEMGL